MAKVKGHAIGIVLFIMKVSVIVLFIVQVMKLKADRLLDKLKFCLFTDDCMFGQEHAACYMRDCPGKYQSKCKGHLLPFIEEPCFSM